MNAIQRRDPFCLEISGHTLVRRKHEFFNQAVRVVALGARDASHQPQIVELDDWLRQIEVNRPPTFPFPLQDHGQFVHQFETFDQVRVSFALRFISLKHLVYRRIGHALGRTNHPRGQLDPNNLAAPVNLHYARHHQSVHLWTQAANVGRKL